MKSSILFIISLTLLNICFTSCNSNKKYKENNKIKVVATTGMIGDAIINIAGDKVNLEILMGPGIDPHLYKATEGDVGKMINANIIFYNGLHLEGKMTDIFEKMEKSKNTVAISKNIDKSKLLSPKEFKGYHDPHIWFDVSLWIEAVKTIRDTFIQYDPKNKNYYIISSEKYITKLKDLHTYVIQKAQILPTEKKVLVTAHDAFNYFGKAYGFNVKGIQGLSTLSEASAKNIEDISIFVVNKKIPAVFIETSVSKRYIEALLESITAKNGKTTIGGYLFSDALGDPNKEEGTYIGMIKHNINTIVEALSK